MNLCLLTVKITQSPRKIFNSAIDSIELKVCFPNITRGLCYAKAQAKGKIANEIFDLYVKGDYLILECELSKKEAEFKPMIEIIIKAYHNAHIIYTLK